MGFYSPFTCTFFICKAKKMGNLTENSRPALYALLIGINAYERFPLGGCINDVKQIEDYLSTKTDFELDVVRLTDREATKKAVVSAFRGHLGKAKSEDTILFYFSGHGTQEKADPVWKDETDQRLECIVCYNGNINKPADYLLADKEIHYLIHELEGKTKAHLVAIFDCCHSGDNTRNGLFMKEVYKQKEVRERRLRLNEAFPIRDWEDFIFSDKIKKTTNESSLTLPEGRHIQLSACESNESALEVGGEGVFTKHLLKVLENSGGDITYQSLRSRIRQYLKFLYEQKPKIFAQGNAEELLSTIFLNRGIDRSQTIGEIVFNKEKGWVLNLGAIHGIASEKDIVVVDPSDAAKTYSGITKKVYVDYAEVTFAAATASKLNEKLVYKVKVTGAQVHNLKIHLNNYDTNQADLHSLADALLQQSGGHYEFEAEEENANYTLQLQAGRIYLTRIMDPFRPLFFPVEIDDQNRDIILSGYLRDISKWHYVRELKNQDSTKQLVTPLKIEFYKIDENGLDTELNFDENKIVLPYDKNGSNWNGKIKIKLTNKTDQNLYVAAFHLNQNFGIDLDFLPQRVLLLEGGKHTFLEYKGNQEIPFSLEQFVKEYNWEGTQEFLQFVISIEEFVAEGLMLEGLPRPPITSDKQKDRWGFRKGRGLGEEKGLGEGEVKNDDWTTQRVSLEFPNPVYNQPDKEWLDEMLDYEETAEFAAGLYYEADSDEYMQPRLKLKPQIKVPPEKRTIFSDLILGFANKVEDFRRSRAYRKVKFKRMRIVAEGDSWFLYPFFVKEILDQLAPLYAIRSMAAAGDTLENYMKKQKYLEVIKEEDPKVFLVSGGGNDILGEQFREYIRDSRDLESGLDPKSYLKEAIWTDIDNLQNLYRKMFSELSEKHPNLPILVHGYDYIIPVDTTKYRKSKSWLGKYMVEKGVKSQEDRKNIISLILDTFNDKLKAVAEDFSQVHYIDVRGGVPDQNGWYDEIHPSDEGFNAIALKFIEKIDKIVKK